MKRSILLVEDDADFASTLAQLLEHSGFQVTHAASLSEGLGEYEKGAFHELALVDLNLPDASGSETVSTLLNANPNCPLVVLTGHNNAELAVQAMQLGAVNFLTKPVRRKALLSAIESAMEPRLVQESETLHAGVTIQVLGESPAWLATLRMLRAAAAAPRTTVLLTGEPGVGKELAANLVHRHSSRSSEPFVPVNVACLPETLIESELFGHSSGAFTGARNARRGLFEQARGGTLFLDEIGELPLEMQAKLLRVLDGYAFRRIGSERMIVPDVRLVAATNRSLDNLVDEGLFREDLLHRLRVLEIHLPPLREREGDIELLARHFLQKISQDMGIREARWMPVTLDVLRSYAWPGNVRELRNAVEHALVIGQGGWIAPKHLPRHLRESVGELGEERSGSKALIDLDSEDDWTLDTAKRRHIERVYERCDGNITQAAKHLGITRQTLRKWINKD